VGTSALVPAWCPFSDKQKSFYRGLAEKVFNACKAGMPHIAKDAARLGRHRSERLKRVYDQLVTDAGVTVLFHTHLAQVEARDGGVGVVTVVNKAVDRLPGQGLHRLHRRRRSLRLGWRDFHKGDAKGEKLMPATHCFILSNVDEYAYLNAPTSTAAIPKPHSRHRPVRQISRDTRHSLLQQPHRPPDRRVQRRGTSGKSTTPNPKPFPPR